MPETDPAYHNNSKYYYDQIGDKTAGAVADWLSDHVDPDTGYVIDNSLTVSGAAADAKAAGEIISWASTEFADELGTALSTGWVLKKFISTNGDTVDINNPGSSSPFAYLVVPCSEGDTFRVWLHGSSVASPWVFIDAEGAKLDIASDNGQYNVTLVAPPNSAYLVCNSNQTNERKVYKGASRISQIEGDVESVSAGQEFLWNGEMPLSLSFEDNTYIEYETGSTKTNSYYRATAYIALPEHSIAIITNCYNSVGGTDGYAFYNSAKQYIRGGKCNKGSATSIKIPDDAAYIRLSSRKSYEEIGVERYATATSAARTASNAGYTVVMLGDSLIGNYNGADSVPACMEAISGAVCHNCAFGGSSMGTDTVASINPNLLPFRGFKVVEAIITDDYSEMEAVIAGGGIDLDYFEEHVNRLKEIDWSTVDIITLSYGINDYLSSVTLDNLSDTHDTNTTGGAFRVALETLWNTYPHIKVMICGPTWIGGTINSGALAWDSDNHQNSIGKYLEEYSELERAVAREYHVPFVEMYNFTNFNSHTWKNYFPSSGSNAIHPNAKGRFVMAKRYAEHLAAL